MADQTENKFRSLLSRLQHAERLFVNASAYLLEVRQDMAELLKEFPEADCGSKNSENETQTTLRRTDESQVSLFLKPEKPCSTSIVDISQDGSVLAVVYPEKREGFQVVMHSLGYHWHRDKRRYEFILGNEPVLDRLAEVANRLVARGFIVCLHNEEAHSMAQSGEYVPWVSRWVELTKDNRLQLVWHKPDDLYDAAKTLPGFRYKDKRMTVPLGALESVAEFAERYKLTLRPAVQVLLDEQRAAMDGADTVDQRPLQAQTSEQQVFPDLDTPETTIDESLRDD